ncbi:MAG TPA: ferritin-like domain-containing protein [Actinomycetota bacterium]|nr:ferritin-like domain-containing protein [Actinomycetota bacterium]
MAIASLQDLFIEQLGDLLDAEKQLVTSLPDMAEAASSSRLRQALEHYLRQSEGQVQRLEQAFNLIGVRADQGDCTAMEGLVKEAGQVVNDAGDPAVTDAGLIAAAQKVEPYQIASYGSARTWAEELGNPHVAELLQTTLNEESAANEALIEIAESQVNASAAR